ncbi:MAG: hypothetical protein GXO29_00845 [Thermotogae bacterium]|nr:hypothetical protein [Thermotogota bacterium]
MRRYLLPLLGIFLSCGQGVLPSKPVISGSWGTEDGRRLEIYWYSLEGAQRYELKGIRDSSARILLNTTDTFAIVSDRFPAYTVVAYAPSDIQESDTLRTSPLEGSFGLHSYGSGFTSAICYYTDSTGTTTLIECDPENEDVRGQMILLLDSLHFISPAKDTAKFGTLNILYVSGPSDMAPLPPTGYADSMAIVAGDTVASWMDRGLLGVFDLSDNVARIVVDSLYVGDGSRDSIRVWLSVRYQTIPRLRWY